MPGRVDEQLQEVKDLTFREGVNSDPPVLQKLGISNIIRRTWATLWAQGSNGNVRLQATDDGRLKVATSSGGFTNISVINETGTDVYVTYSFPTTTEQVDFIVSMNPLNIQVSSDGEIYGDAVQVGAGQSWSPPVSVLKIKIQNAVAGNNGSLQAVGYY